MKIKETYHEEHEETRRKIEEANQKIVYHEGHEGHEDKKKLRLQVIGFWVFRDSGKNLCLSVLICVLIGFSPRRARSEHEENRKERR